MLRRITARTLCRPSSTVSTAMSSIHTCGPRHFGRSGPKMFRHGNNEAAFPFGFGFGSGKGGNLQDFFDAASSPIGSSNASSTASEAAGTLRSLFQGMDLMGPRISVKEFSDSITLELELPRYRKEHIQVLTEADGKLTIKGTVKPPAATDPSKSNEGQHDFLFGNLFLGSSAPQSFSRSVRFDPLEFDLKSVTSDLSHGVLTVRIPRVPVAKTPAAAPSSSRSPVSQPPTSSAAAPSPSPAPAASVEAFQELAQMNWPPALKHAESPDFYKYEIALPANLPKTAISLRFIKSPTGGAHQVELTVALQKRVEKKGADGHVEFSESSTVSYRTAYPLPHGANAEDLSTKFENGNLTLSVRKPSAHAPSDSIPIH